MNTQTALKFEGFAIGDRIKAFDFEPRPGRKDRYVVGRIIEVVRNGSENLPFAHYWIRVERDTSYTDELRRKYVAVPMETTFDYDGRVEEVTQ